MQLYSMNELHQVYNAQLTIGVVHVCSPSCECLIHSSRYTKYQDKMNGMVSCLSIPRKVPFMHASSVYGGEAKRVCARAMRHLQRQGYQ